MTLFLKSSNFPTSTHPLLIRKGIRMMKQTTKKLQFKLRGLPGNQRPLENVGEEGTLWLVTSRSENHNPAFSRSRLGKVLVLSQMTIEEKSELIIAYNFPPGLNNHEKFSLIDSEGLDFTVEATDQEVHNDST